MPAKDKRAQATAYKGKMRTSGRMNVTYRDAKGRTRNALVLDAGTTSGLKLQLVDTGTIIDNVAKATTPKSANAYIAREQ